MRSSRFVIAALAAAPVMGLLVAAHAPSPPLPVNPQICLTSYNVYTVSQAVRNTCDIKTYPLQKVSRLADGGTSYHYNLAGQAMWVNIPPKGFHPVTANPKELALYGLYRPPAGRAAARARWDTMARRLSWNAPPKVMYASAPHSPYAVTAGLPKTRPASTHGPVTSKTSQSWSGWLAKQGTYTSASAAYVEPKTYSTQCDGLYPVKPSALYWTGLGGWGIGKFLAQNGTGFNVPSANTDAAWWEVIPGSMHVVTLTISQGDTMEVNTSESTTGGYHFTFSWIDVTTGKTTNASASTTQSYYDTVQATADDVAERPKVGGTIHDVPLANFRTMNFLNESSPNGDLANGSPIGNFPNVQITMTGASGATAAQPGSLAGNGEAFTDTQHLCIPPKH